jgi:hypothetical protein
MSNQSIVDSSFEVHDPEILAQARAILGGCASGAVAQLFASWAFG